MSLDQLPLGVRKIAWGYLSDEERSIVAWENPSRAAELGLGTFTRQHLIERAVENGWGVPAALEKGLTDAHAVLIVAARVNDAKSLELANKAGAVKVNDALRVASVCGSLDALTKLRELGVTDWGVAGKLAIESGQIGALKLITSWVTSADKEEYGRLYAKTACRGGKIEAMACLRKVDFVEFKRTHILDAAIFNQLDAMNLLREWTGPLDDYFKTHAMKIAALSGKIGAMKLVKSWGVNHVGPVYEFVRNNKLRVKNKYTVLALLEEWLAAAQK